jgi:uncharacterized protein YjbI with pentapeptide repeats
MMQLDPYPAFRSTLKIVCWFMSRKHTEQAIGLVFEKAGIEKLTVGWGVYEECQFRHCNFAHANLSNLMFRNCTFDACDMSLAKLGGTGLQEVRFANCKLLGITFSDCRKLLLQMEFERCLLKLSVFSGLDLKNTSFVDCDLQEADFTGANMSGAAFGNCDLKKALFFHTNLEKADFRTAYNYSISPENNRLRKARFSMHGIAGLLDAYDINIE